MGCGEIDPVATNPELGREWYACRGQACEYVQFKWVQRCVSDRSLFKLIPAARGIAEIVAE
jgi:hypothetical protein